MKQDTHNHHQQTVSLPHKGGCYCGKIDFTVTGALRPVIYCHCSQCRKFSGHFVAASASQSHQLKINGEITWFQSSEHHQRGFCGTCGTPLFWTTVKNHGNEQHFSIFAGAFDNVQLIAKEHIFTAEKASYYTIDDSLPQHNYNHQ